MWCFTDSRIPFPSLLLSSFLMSTFHYTVVLLNPSVSTTLKSAQTFFSDRIRALNSKIQFIYKGVWFGFGLFFKKAKVTTESSLSALGWIIIFHHRQNHHLHHHRLYYVKKIVGSPNYYIALIMYGQKIQCYSVNVWYGP